jgi:RNA polymerase sigma-54 factor
VQLQKPALIAEQRQKLSPQMIQSIKLMAMPLQELKEQIQEELESNPALELVSDGSTLSLESLPEGESKESEEAAPFENSSDSGFASRSGYDEDSKRMFIEGTIARAETLQEHLLWQLRVQKIEDSTRTLGEALIQNLDDDGFHKEDPYALFPAAERRAVDDAMALVRSFEPAGTCCVDYRESLLVQAELAGDAPEAALAILRDHVGLLEKGKHTEIQKRLKIGESELQAALAFIKGLSPFPGRAYSTEEPIYVVPDILVKLKDDDFVIVLNDEEIPVLGIDPFFDGFADRGGPGDEKGEAARAEEKATGAYVRDNIKRAKFFIRSIHQRNQTLIKVARAVVEFQRAFFAEGPKRLAPLTLKDVADEVGVHETTVSRIANRKYMQTDWGIFELRYFFTNSISGAGSRGSSFSKEGVKQVIKEIIQAEDSILSDRDITEVLARKGIKLARRTVAKYRGELDLDSSFGRKRS